MRRLLKWGCLATLGLVALIVVFGVIGALVAPTPPGSDPLEQVQQQDQQAQPQEEPQQPEAKPEAKPGTSEATEDYLHLTGTEGIPFSCAVMHGDMNQTTVDGTVPEKIPLKDMGWTATSENSCQKMGTQGTLKVSIVVGGDVKDTNSTSAQYGIASVGYPR
jgi:hypothetical protein